MLSNISLKHIAAFTILGTALGVSLASAKEPAQIDKAEEIKSYYAAFENILNEKGNPEKLMDFLHKSVSQDAKFSLEVHNPDQNQAAPDMILDKAEYINSYLYGPRQIRNYKVQIKTMNVEWDEKAQAGTSKEIFLERGLTINPKDPLHSRGRAFTSQTSCTSVHGLNDQDQLVVKNSACKTEIFYEQEV